MKVPGQDPIRLLEAYLNRAKGVQKGAPTKPPASANPTPGDNVEISEKAKDYQQLNQLISSLPELRMDRVSEVLGKIDSGTYAPRAEDIAEKVLRSIVTDEVL